MLVRDASTAFVEYVSTEREVLAFVISRAANGTPAISAERIPWPRAELEIASRTFGSARRMLLSHLRSVHPDWDQHQIEREAARRLSHGAV